MNLGGREARVAKVGRDHGIVHCLTLDCCYEIITYLSGIHTLHAEIEHDRLLIHLTNRSERTASPSRKIRRLGPLWASPWK
jgi:hypothetical protein